MKTKQYFREACHIFPVSFVRWIVVFEIQKITGDWLNLFASFNKQQLSRIYPKGTRVDSSNYMPQVLL